MKLIIGGYAQGKLDYVLETIKTEECYIFNNELPNKMQIEEAVVQKKKMIINYFHKWVRTCLLNDRNPEEEVKHFLKETSEVVIISDEIGNGIVPMEAFEREYRECTGRILMWLASQADEVVRVVCGIGQKIK